MSVEGRDSFRFEALEYVPSFTERARTTATTWLELGLFGLAGIAIVMGGWASLTTYPPESPLYWGAISFGGALLVFLVVLARGTSVRRPVVIRNGWLRVDLPVRRPDGRSAREVPLHEIADVTPSFGLSGDDGIDVTLADGTAFFLARRLLGHGGVALMEQLCAPFQRSFRREIQEQVKAGYSVATLKVSRRKDDAILLAIPVFSYSGKKRTRLSPADVASLRMVTTRLSGPMYLVEFSDGTPRLLSVEDSRKLRLETAPPWKAKVIQA